MYWIPFSVITYFLVLKYETITFQPQVSYKKYFCGMHANFLCVDSSHNDLMLVGMSKYFFLCQWERETT